MKIFGYYDNIQKIDKTYLKQSRSIGQKQNNSESTSIKKTDEIIISPKAAELQKYEELAKSISDIREDKTKSIKDQLESGNYKINGKSIAKSIIDLIS
ncbi:TPA: flagellar biosynthesis anti-sigma factor FlgM [bacterium]|nr:flagellar biosynthesis anti-sigma factor FlgM [bacterium]